MGPYLPGGWETLIYVNLSAIGEKGFANLYFSYIAPLLYNKWPITIKLIDTRNTFKSRFKAFLFFPCLWSVKFSCSGRLCIVIFLVFLLIVFFFVSFLSSACEFQFIEKIHSWQTKSKFYYYYFIKLSSSLKAIIVFQSSCYFLFFSFSCSFIVTLSVPAINDLFISFFLTASGEDFKYMFSSSKDEISFS